MGICHSTKNKNKDHQPPQISKQTTAGAASSTDKSPNAEQPKGSYIRALGNTNSVAITSDVIVARSEVNPEHLYKKLKLLGSGAFGEVWLVSHKELHKDFAMKIIKKRTNKPSEEKEIMNEIKMLKELDHPKILKVLEFYSTPTQYYIITEYCALGELFHEIEKVELFDEGQAAFLMNQIFRAVAYCHGQNVIHRDLKPENIMIMAREPNKCLQIKIIDFGTAKTFERGQSENRYVGSSYYIAPEVIQRRYNEKCDLWSCGVIMYILLTGKPPFGGNDDKEIIQKVKTGVYDTKSPFFTRLSTEAKDLIQKLLQTDTKKRLSALEALQHKWFKNPAYRAKEKINIISPSMARLLLSNLKSYHGANVLRCAVIAYLVHRNTNIEQCNEASKLFNEIDANGDGKIEKHELIDGLMNYWRLPKSEVVEEVETIFENIDNDHNGYIEYEEFIRAAIDQSFYLTNTNLRFAFNYFDRDNSGKLTIDEVKKRFLQCAKNANDPQAIKQLQSSFSSIDINKDGGISFEEFCKMMKNIISS